jgi:hypothetical protein
MILRRRASVNSHPVHIWTPAEFDPIDIIKPCQSRYAEFIRYFIHRVHYGRVFGQERDGYVPLKAKYLARFCVSMAAYKQIRDLLIASGVVVCDGRYVEGEKCYGYRLGPTLVDARFRKYALTDEILARKVREDRYASIYAPHPVHRHLLKWLFRLRIDAEGAMRELYRLPFIEPTDESAIEFIADQLFRFTVCDYGRVHTNITNLKGSLRPFLNYHGQTFVNLDVANSQPLIFTLLLYERYGRRLPGDAGRFREECQRGLFYEAMMDEAGIPPEQRPSFKCAFFGCVLFCKNEPMKYHARVFRRQYPSVFDLVWSLKEEDYTQLAKKLQRAESDLIIGHVAERFRREMPRKFVATIHDSVLVLPEDAEQARSILLEEFRAVGLKPTIRSEIYRKAI